MNTSQDISFETAVPDQDISSETPSPESIAIELGEVLSSMHNSEKDVRSFLLRNVSMLDIAWSVEYLAAENSAPPILDSLGSPPL